MTKVLLVGDLHFRAKKLDDISEAWTRITSYAYDNKFDFIAQAGDVFDHANVFGKDATIGTIYDHFLQPFRTRQNPVKLLTVLGNHDIAGKAEDKDALVPIDSYPWICVQRKIGVYSLSKDIHFVCVPWVDKDTLFARLVNRGMKEKEALSKISFGIGEMMPFAAKKVKELKQAGDCVVILLSHMEVTGALRDNGMAQTNGVFEFSPADLVKIGADAYALGHIHKRQTLSGLPSPNDGYLGALCQLNFGEAGNMAGARVLEIERGRIAKDYWVNDDNSPSYYTVEDNLNGMKFKPGDHVKLRADKRPDVLPEGIVFEKKASKAQERQRTNDDVTTDSKIDVLLKAWHEASKCQFPLDLLMKAAQTISLPDNKGESIGSLERLDAIRLHNITSHKKTEIDLKGVTGTIAVEGPNGSGKTSAMESLLVALYGDCPSRSLSDLTSKGMEDPSSVEVEFYSSGKSYLARREFKTGKTLSHRAFLTNDGKAIAGPGVGSVNDACSSIVGDKDLVLAGVFSSQGDVGSLVEFKPAQRKELFAKLIGTDRFLAMAEIARDSSRAEAATIQAQDARMESLKKELETEEEDKKSLEVLKGKNSDLQERIEKDKESLSSGKESLAAVEQANKERDQKLKAISDLETEMSKIQNDGRELKKKRDGLAKADAKVVEGDLKKAREAVKTVSSLKEKASKVYADISSLSAKASEKMEQASKIKAEIADSFVVACKEADEKIEAIRERRQEGLTKFQSRIQNGKTIIAKLEAKVEEEKLKIERLKGFPDQPACKECPLAKDGIEARQSKNPSKLIEGKAKLAGLETEASNYEKETSRLVSEVVVPKKESYGKDKMKEHDALVSTADLLRSQAAGMTVSQFDAPIKECEGLASQVADLEKKLEEIRQQSMEVVKYDAMLDGMRNRYKDLSQKVAEAKPLVPVKKDDSALKILVKELEESLSKAHDEIVALAGEIGKQEAKILAHQKRWVELAKITQEIGEKKERVQTMLTLASAFGRDGIPQLLVERTIPRFQDIMNELMSEFQDSWAIEVKSQKTNKSGNVEEVIDIPVDDGSGERDISTYSGGERKLLKYVVRIAFAALQAERTGKGLKILILDEAMDALDDERAGDFVSMIGKLGKFFNQVFLVSHNARILSTIPRRISFSRLPGQPSSVKLVAPKA